jgi:hypothetical protein
VPVLDDPYSIFAQESSEVPDVGGDLAFENFCCESCEILLEYLSEVAVFEVSCSILDCFVANIFADIFDSSTIVS